MTRVNPKKTMAAATFTATWLRRHCARGRRARAALRCAGAVSLNRLLGGRGPGPVARVMRGARMVIHARDAHQPGADKGRRGPGADGPARSAPTRRPFHRTMTPFGGWLACRH